MNSKNKKNILVVCNDAGGANLLSAFVKANRDKFNFTCFVSGPAVKIFKDKGIKVKEYFSPSPEAQIKIFKNLWLVLTGSSWSVPFEIDFINAAKRQGVPSATFIDHWVNFKERFGFPRKGWRNNLPDQIWVGDRYAYDLAKKSFVGKDIKMKKNWYFEEVVEKYRSLTKNRTLKARKILLISEPFTSPTNYHGDKKHKKQSEISIINSLVDSVGNLGRPIVIRLHPSEKVQKYAKIINKNEKKLNIRLSVGRDPLADIVEAKYVIGMESAFLVLSALCGKKTFSYIPDLNYKCPLPFKNIIKINDLNKLIRTIK